MLAAVLNVPHRSSGGKKVIGSVMPHLARAANGALEVEGLLRPRMPVVRIDNDGPAEEGEVLDQMDEDIDTRDVQEANEKTLEMYRQMFTAGSKEVLTKKRPLDSVETVTNEAEPMTWSPAEAAKKTKHTHDGFLGGDGTPQRLNASTTVPDSSIGTTAQDFATSAPSLSRQNFSHDQFPNQPASTAIPPPTTTATTSKTSSNINPNSSPPAPKVSSPRNEDSSADDDDDFEIPTLVMDLDTEDEVGEEEEEEEEEEEGKGGVDDTGGTTGET
jgi:hypothetical protein